MRCRRAQRLPPKRLTILSVEVIASGSIKKKAKSPSMRRNLINQFNPVIRRAGVTARLISRNTSVSIPVVRVTNSKGFAPTCLRYTSHKSSVSGTRPLTKRTSLAKRVSFMSKEFEYRGENLKVRKGGLPPLLCKFIYLKIKTKRGGKPPFLTLRFLPAGLPANEFSNSPSNPSLHKDARPVQHNH